MSALRTDRLAELKIGVGVIALVLAAFSLWALRHVLAPFMLAVFLLQLIGGLEQSLVDRLRVPQKMALPLAIALVVGFFAFAIWMIETNAVGLVEESSGYVDRLNALLQMASNRLGLNAAPTINSLLSQIDPGKYVRTVAFSIGHLLEGAVFVLIYLAFMLASRKNFGRKLNEMFQRGEDEALIVFRRIQHGVESYIFVQTVVGFIIAGLSALIMWPMGLPHIWFWSFLIFLANYIPAIGAALGVLLPPIYGLVELDALWKPLLMLVLFESVHFSVSHVVQPRLQGQSLNMDPIVVLLSLAFWSVLLGLTGAFLSTPLTVIVMAVCAEFKSVRWIAILLSEDAKPYDKAA